MTTASAELLACWRCGSRAIVEPTPCLPGFYHVECLNTKECNAYGNFGSRDEAIAWWNTRAALTRAGPLIGAAVGVWQWMGGLG
jgi:hypothetical protein